MKLKITEFNADHLIGMMYVDENIARKAVAIENNIKIGGFAWSTFLDNKCVGCGGFFLDSDGKYLAWVDPTPELLALKVEFHKTALKLFTHVKAAVGAGKIKAMCDTAVLNNLRWAKCFGFELTPVVMMEVAGGLSSLRATRTKPLYNSQTCDESGSQSPVTDGSQVTWK